MTRARGLLAARVGFVLLVVGCAWWGFSGRWDEIAETVAGVGPARFVGAVACALAGLALTGALWGRLLSALGTTVAPRHAASVFFVGQLGKYIPGSVWSFAAQAQLGRRHDVPVRTSLTASTLFLLLHTASGLLLGGTLAAAGAVSTRLGGGWWLVVALGGAVSMTPAVVRLLGDRLAGAGTRTAFGARDLAGASALMLGVWSCYGASLWLLVPGGSGSGELVTATAVFALAHAAGVLLLVAPAGLGAREAVVVALLAPVVGVPAAAAAALLARVAHSLADFVIAAGAAGWAHRGAAREVVGAGHP